MNFLYSVQQTPKSPLLLDHAPDPHHPSTTPKPRISEALSSCPQDKSTPNRSPRVMKHPSHPQNTENVTPWIMCINHTILLATTLQPIKKKIRNPTSLQPAATNAPPPKPESFRTPRGRIRPPQPPGIQTKNNLHPADTINQASPTQSPKTTRMIKTEARPKNSDNPKIYRTE